MTKRSLLEFLVNSDAEGRRLGHRTINPNHLRNDLAEVEAYSEKMEGDRPQEEAAV